MSAALFPLGWRHTLTQLGFVVSLEHDVIPSIGMARVPDDLILRLAKYLQNASRLYDFDLPGVTSDLPDSLPNSISSEVARYDEDGVKISNKEARFDSDFNRQARDKLNGTTAEVVTVGRERFRYWSLETLFLLCSDIGEGKS